MILLYKIYAFIFGAMVGSFLNVLILRLPKGEKFFVDRSRCPKCGFQLKWYHNIPIISYILLRGKCASCKSRISLQYPVIELLTAVISLLLFGNEISLHTTTSYLFFFTIACCLLVHFVIDIRHQILPDSINIYLGVIFFIHAIFFFPIQHWLLGGIIGFAIPYLITFVFYKLRGVVGLGGGDIKLFGVLGIYLGPLGIIHNMLFACVFGSVLMLPLLIFKIIKRDQAIAFGPFIILVAVIQIFLPNIFKMMLGVVLF
ncbi:prepilin peptidase [Halobacteriovorax sp.]|uniref:prepilin peptidase n=1 Tax=Halobacteriovorax sp. TaxID=2020862 RepID=UPI003AF2DD03